MAPILNIGLDSSDEDNKLKKRVQMVGEVISCLLHPLSDPLFGDCMSGTQ